MLMHYRARDRQFKCTNISTFELTIAHIIICTIKPVRALGCARVYWTVRGVSAARAGRGLAVKLKVLFVQHKVSACF